MKLISPLLSKPLNGKDLELLFNNNEHLNILTSSAGKSSSTTILFSIVDSLEYDFKVRVFE